MDQGFKLLYRNKIENELLKYQIIEQSVQGFEDYVKLHSNLSNEDQRIVEGKYLIYKQMTRFNSLKQNLKISKEERQKLNILNSNRYVYGEIKFKAFSEIFLYTLQTHCQEMLQAKSGGIFYDLGHGSGKAVLAAALLYPFEACKGIEIQSGLFQQSLNLKQIYEQEIQQLVSQNQDLFPNQFKIPSIQYKREDFLQSDFTNEATFVFANSTCFEKELMSQLSEKCKALRDGTIFITTTKILPGYHFRIIDYFNKEMSWGECTVYIYKKIVFPVAQIIINE